MNATANVSETFMSFGVIAHHAKISNAPMGDVFNFGVAKQASTNGIRTETAIFAGAKPRTGQPGEVLQYAELAPGTHKGGFNTKTLPSGIVARDFNVSEPKEEVGYH